MKNEKTKTIVTKAMMVEAQITDLLATWYSMGGIASDVDNYYSDNIDCEENDFSFKKDGVYIINVEPKMVFAFLTELQAITGQPDYINFSNNCCTIRKDTIQIEVLYKFGR